MPDTKLTRSETDRMIAGVCGGLAAYLGIDSVLVRLAFVILLFASGIGFPIYLVMWVIMPSEAGAGKVGSEVIHDNIEEMSQTVSTSMSRIGRPNAIGVVLIVLGVYFMLNQFGGLGWLSDIFWPLLIIGVGIYLLSRRGR
jgi:phage shock protein C